MSDLPQCLLCGVSRGYMNEMGLSKHISTQHQDIFVKLETSPSSPTYICKICGEIKFHRLLQLMHHVHSKHPSHNSNKTAFLERLKDIADNCARVSQRRKKNQVKICPPPTGYSVLIDGTYYCELCPFDSDSYDDFLKHLDGHLMSSKGYRCYVCGYSNSDKEMVKLHGRLHLKTKFLYPRNKVFHCPFCRFETYVEEVQKHHIRRHQVIDGPHNHTCVICKFSVPDMRVAVYHKKIAHPDHSVDATASPETLVDSSASLSAAEEGPATSCDADDVIYVCTDETSSEITDGNVQSLACENAPVIQGTSSRDDQHSGNRDTAIDELGLDVGQNQESANTEENFSSSTVTGSQDGNAVVDSGSGEPVSEQTTSAFIEDSHEVVPILNSTFSSSQLRLDQIQPLDQYTPTPAVMPQQYPTIAIADQCPPTLAKMPRFTPLDAPLSEAPACVPSEHYQQSGLRQQPAGLGVPGSPGVPGVPGVPGGTEIPGFAPITCKKTSCPYCGDMTTEDRIGVHLLMYHGDMLEKAKKDFSKISTDMGLTGEKPSATINHEVIGPSNNNRKRNSSDVSVCWYYDVDD